MAWNGLVLNFPTSQISNISYTLLGVIFQPRQREKTTKYVSATRKTGNLWSLLKISFILPINVHIASIFTSLLFHGNPRKRLDFSISRRIPLETIWSPHFHICKNLRVWYFNFIHYFSIQLDFEDILKIQKIMDPMKTIKSNIHTVSLTNYKSSNILPLDLKILRWYYVDPP